MILIQTKFVDYKCLQMRLVPPTHLVNLGIVSQRFFASDAAVQTAPGPSNLLKVKFEDLTTLAINFHKMAPRTTLFLKTAPGITLEGLCVGSEQTFALAMCVCECVCV